jgi:small subunit ribosomal protein S1
MSHPELLPTEPDAAASDSGSSQPAPLQRPGGSRKEDSFEAILSEFEKSHRQPKEGQRQGTVVAVSPDGVIVDIGFKTEGMIPAEEFRGDSGDLEVAVGDRIVFSIKGRDSGGYYLLSKVEVARPKDWSSLEKAFASKSPIAGVVTGVVKGGLSVDVGVRAFLPASRSGAKDAAELEALVEKEISCLIIKLDVADEDVVVDRRALLEEEELKERRKAFDALEVGSVVHGTVRTLTDFGAFVDLGGLDGLLHVADMSWTRVNKPADVLKVGDELDVKILSIDRGSHRISLGLKQLAADPWTLAAEKYKTNDRINGKVTRVVDFGAFVELEPGIEGLIHVSDLSWSKKARAPKEIVKPGELVDVVITNVNTDGHRIGLSLKQALGDPWEEAARKFPADSVVEGRITSIVKFGAFMELAEGIEGMIHIGDLSNEKRINHPDEVLKVGQVVRAQVLEFDRAKRRIRLGVKQLQPTVADEYIVEHKIGDVVTGRVVDIVKSSAKVELGDGLMASCVLPKQSKEEAAAPAATDVSSLSAMLSAKWKQGKSGAATSDNEPVRPGEVRSFRITAMDVAAKRITVELAS